MATNLPTVGISLLVLLGLSSHHARDYATRTATFPSASLGVASPGRYRRPHLIMKAGGYAPSRDFTCPG